MIRPAQSAPVRPYVSFTCFDVGTTTIRLGASRYGPFAPDTFQLGKYDSFTSTGFPISDTSKEIVSTVLCTFDTCAGVTARGSAFARSAAFTRCQSFGPDCAYAVPNSSRFTHHGAVVHSQPSCIS